MDFYFLIMEDEITRTTKAQLVVRILLGLFLLLAGISHLSFLRIAFLAQVPNWLPINPDKIVVISGFVEIILGSSLILLHKQQIIVGWIVALFFIIVFPGNIAKLVNHKHSFGLNSDLLLWIRLPFQPLLIGLVLWCTGALKRWRNKIKSKNQLMIYY